MKSCFRPPAELPWAQQPHGPLPDLRYDAPVIWIALVFILFLLGLILLGLELFVIPGFGVIGVMGIASLIGSVGVAWWKLGGWEAGVTFGLGVAALAGLLYAFSKSKASGEMVLTAEANAGIAVDLPKIELGSEGTAATPLRPMGVVRFAERELSVISEGLFVDAGTPVRVTRVEGPTIFVAPTSDYQGGTSG